MAMVSTTRFLFLMRLPVWILRLITRFNIRMDYTPLDQPSPRTVSHLFLFGLHLPTEKSPKDFLLTRFRTDIRMERFFAMEPGRVTDLSIEIEIAHHADPEALSETVRETETPETEVSAHAHHQ